MITSSAIEVAAERWARQQKHQHRAQSKRWSQILFRQTATAWLLFLGRLSLPRSEPKPFASLVEHFTDKLQNERGLSSVTVANYLWHRERFLAWFSTQQQIFLKVSVADTDTFLTRQGRHWSRVSIVPAQRLSEHSFDMPVSHIFSY